ncbi:MAG: DUF2330 domain-containing protein, partial [Planctomycetota bacterium]|nr:DUF2330 domain-containing protein [Planctomycetota bacterium]
MKRRSLIGGLAALLLGAGGLLIPASACIHGPQGFKGKLSADAYRAILFHSGQREELILFTNLEFESTNRPKKLAWILALPSIPDGYSTNIQSSLFNDAASLMPPRRMPRTLRERSKSPGKNLNVTVIKVGPYQIHQVSASGQNAVKPLNGWFKKNGFATKKESEMQFFIDGKYTFLCLQVDWKSVDKKNAKKGTKVEALPPLRISFKTDRPFVPLKFSSHQGGFDLRLLTFTKTPIDWLKSLPVLQQIGFSKLSKLDQREAQNLALSPAKFKNTLRATYQDIIKETRLPDSKEWYFNAISADSINSSKGIPITKWKSDFYLDLNDDPHRLEVRRLLYTVIKYSRRGGKPDKKALAALEKLGEKAVPGIMQSLARESFQDLQAL